MPARQSISVVDDDASLRAAVESLLRATGYVVETFASAEEFLLRDTRGFSCVIADIHMPGMSGLELAERLRTMASTPPIILITAHSEEGLANRARSSGAAFFLTKPFAAEKLLDCLAKLGADSDRLA